MCAVIESNLGPGASLHARRGFVDAPWEAWPLDPPAGDRALEALVESVRGGLTEPGHVVVRLPDGEDEHLSEAAWNLLTALARPVAQYANGELMSRVEVLAAAGTESHYSHTNASGAFHTDGTFLPEIPDVAGLLCLSPAAEGGATVLVDCLPLVADLAQTDPAALRTLREPHPFSTNGQLEGQPIRRQSIVWQRPDGRAGVTYLRRYIEDGYAATGGQPDHVRAAFDAFDALAAEPERQHAVDLRRGDLLLFDNTRFVHGRHAFVERGQRRRLRRVYGLMHGGAR